jgi:uncharacterized protein
MIKACFMKKAGRLNGFVVSGHSGYSKSGSDIVCAAVSSVVELTCNGITELAKVKTDISVLDDTVTLKLLEFNDVSIKMLKALYLQLNAISEEYPKYLQIEQLDE